MFKGVNVCVYVGEGLRRSFATPDPFVLTNKICLNQICFSKYKGVNYQNVKGKRLSGVSTAQVPYAVTTSQVSQNCTLA